MSRIIKNEAGTLLKTNDKMANDSMIESFAIRVFNIFVRRAEGEPDTPTEQNAVKTL
ncbi:hypothetical protein ACI2JA_19115 [Alkalihalobacillus sp. NPDC078783]